MVAAIPVFPSAHHRDPRWPASPIRAATPGDPVRE